jgi:hypothetical protein
MTCRRVDCADEDLGLGQRFTAYRPRPDGMLTGRDYSEAADRCRFKTHPRRQDASPYGVGLPSD